LQYFEIHPTHPQERLLSASALMLSKGGVFAIPTDSSYALVCQLDNPKAVQTIRRIRGVDERHLLTLLCKDLTQVASYAKVDNRQYRLLKAATPGAFTFILDATKEVPKRVSHPQRKTIGLRVPNHPVVQGLLRLHEQALLCTTLILPDEDFALNDPNEIRSRIGNQIEGLIDAGSVSQEPTTVLDLTPMNQAGEPILIRQGGGNLSLLGISIHTN
jgi:tRNA threonylcarbamoyl adenosine modification protein (Sua5/YciO/YrdC/YwlC family)